MCTVPKTPTIKKHAASDQPITAARPNNAFSAVVSVMWCAAVYPFQDSPVSRPASRSASICTHKTISFTLPAVQQYLIAIIFLILLPRASISEGL